MIRTLAAATGALAIGAVILAPPASAEDWPGDNWSPLYLSCSYKLHPHWHKVSGECDGHTPWGDAEGKFKGSLRHNGSAKGKLTLDSSAGSMSGSFDGLGFDGGSARGTFQVTLGSLSASGNFLAVLG